MKNGNVKEILAEIKKLREESASRLKTINQLAEERREAWIKVEQLEASLAKLRGTNSPK